jgi:protein disulfide-isomerase A1
VQLEPEYKNVAKVLIGDVKVGVVDCDEDEELCDYHNITGYPTILIFTGKNFEQYNGTLKATEIAKAARAKIKKTSATTKSVRLRRAA